MYSLLLLIFLNQLDYTYHAFSFIYTEYSQYLSAYLVQCMFTYPSYFFLLWIFKPAGRMNHKVLFVVCWSNWGIANEIYFNLFQHIWLFCKFITFFVNFYSNIFICFFVSCCDGVFLKVLIFTRYILDVLSVGVSTFFDVWLFSILHTASFEYILCYAKISSGDVNYDPKLHKRICNTTFKKG